MTAPPARDAGFTLIEVVVALALFAIVALAGAALVDTVLAARARTAARLDRLGDLQRAMVVITRDFTELADAPLAGGPVAVTFTRHGAQGDARVGYRVARGGFERVVDGRPQRVLDAVAAVRWRYYAPSGGWRDRWPAALPGWPRAVAIEIDLVGPGLAGTLRRVVDLPGRPLPPGAVAAAP